MREALKHGDKTTTGGVLQSTVIGFSHHGVPVAAEGDYATCPACKTGAPVVNDATPHFTLPDGRNILVRGARVMCQCANKPLVVPSQHDFMIEVTRGGMHSSPYAASAYVPANKAGFNDSGSALQDHPDLICPNMTNEEFASLVVRLRDDVLRRTNVRLAELAQWGEKEKEAVATWFGIADEAVRHQLLDGLRRMKGVLSTLTPANFVRYSETALRHVGCVPRPGKRQIMAAICKPDISSHTIAIALDFCNAPYTSDRLDSQMLTLAHEISHFLDTMDTTDDQYRLWNAIALARSKSPRCIANADNVAGYIVVDGKIPSDFGTSIR